MRASAYSRSGRALINAVAFAYAIYGLLPAARSAGNDQVGENFLWLAVILLAANIAARGVERWRLPGVLGELLVGVVLGNLTLLGIGQLDSVKNDAVILFVAELGAVILLFQVGLESSVQQMREVGARAFAVAAVGIALPFALGVFAAGPLLFPAQPFNSYLFLGATLTATSVGITGRVFQDLGMVGTREAQIVLGAAVIDDVLGLVILAVVTSIVTEGSVSAFGIALLIAKAVLFVGGSIAAGRIAGPWLGKRLARVHAGVAMKLALIVSLCLTSAWVAQAIGLAPIVGAFAAGLMLEPVFLRDFEEPDIVQELRPLVRNGDDERALRIRGILEHHSGHHHQQLLEPLGYFFVPVFFVYTGMQVDLRYFLDPGILLIGASLTVAALIGKIVAGWVAGPVNRAVVGWGMVPRGEVGLIFAMVGRQLGVVDDRMFAVVIIMVILTTLLAPLALMRLLGNRPGG